MSLFLIRRYFAFWSDSAWPLSFQLLILACKGLTKATEGDTYCQVMQEASSRSCHARAKQWQCQLHEQDSPKGWLLYRQALRILLTHVLHTIQFENCNIWPLPSSFEKTLFFHYLASRYLAFRKWYLFNTYSRLCEILWKTYQACKYTSHSRFSTWLAQALLSLAWGLDIQIAMCAAKECCNLMSCTLHIHRNLLCTWLQHFSADVQTAYVNKSPSTKLSAYCFQDWNISDQIPQMHGEYPLDPSLTSVAFICQSNEECQVLLIVEPCQLDFDQVMTSFEVRLLFWMAYILEGGIVHAEFGKLKVSASRMKVILLHSYACLDRGHGFLKREI